MTDIKLYGSPVDFLSDDEMFLSAYRLVSPERQNKVNRLYCRKDKNLSLGAELLLQYGINALRLPITDITFTYGANGKPRIENSRIHFNLSHAGSYVICAVSNQMVGCDIERIGSGNMTLAKRFFAKPEYQLLAETDKDEQASLFYRIWTLKESYMKATGEGFHMPMAQFITIPNSYGYTTIHSADGKPFFAKEFFHIESYACALCSPENCRNTDMTLVNLADFVRKRTALSLSNKSQY